MNQGEEMVNFSRWIFALTILTLFAGLALAQTATAVPQIAMTAIAQVFPAPGLKTTEITGMKLGDPNNPEYILVIRLVPSATPTTPTVAPRNTNGFFPVIQNQGGLTLPLAQQLQIAGLAASVSGFDTGLPVGGGSCKTVLQYAPVGPTSMARNTIPTH